MSSAGRILRLLYEPVRYRVSELLPIVRPLRAVILYQQLVAARGKRDLYVIDVLVGYVAVRPHQDAVVHLEIRYRHAPFSPSGIIAYLHNRNRRTKTIPFTQRNTK